MLTQETAAQPTSCLRPLLDINNEAPQSADQLRNFEPKGTQGTARLVLMPEVKFNCSGIITSYSAVTITSKAFDSLAKAITFSLWRPRGQGLYDVVGRNELVFSSFFEGTLLDLDNSTGQIQANMRYFMFTNKEPSNYISFQPGDILGWQVEEAFFVRNMQILNLVYREVNTPEEGVEFVSTFITLPPPCTVSECDSRPNSTFTRQPQLLPYLSIQYSKCLSVSIADRIKQYLLLSSSILSVVTFLSLTTVGIVQFKAVLMIQ